MIVTFTPIRSGSKGLPHKNIRLLNGKPLFHYVVLEAQKASSVDEVWISTDSEYYASLAPPGVLVHRRSKESAMDGAKTDEVVMEFVKSHPNVSTVVILQATSPTTTSKDIEETLRLSASGKGCISVHPLQLSLYNGNEPIWINTKDQQVEPTFIADGGIYVLHTADFVKTKSIPSIPCHTMQVQHAKCDIDSVTHFEKASVLISRRNTAFLHFDETHIRLKSSFQTKQWSLQTLNDSKEQFDSFINNQIQTLNESLIYLSTVHNIIERDDHYTISLMSEYVPKVENITIQKSVDGKIVKNLNNGDSAVMGLVMKNNIENKDLLVLVFGTEIASGLYVNDWLVTNTNIGQLLDSEVSTNFETVDPSKLVQELNKIKNMLSLDDVYVNGIAHQYKDMLAKHGIKLVYSNGNICHN